jgi:hypothetical protein
MNAQEMTEWAISVLDSIGHDLETGAESKKIIAKRAHSRAEQLRRMLKKLRQEQENGKWI